MKFEIKNSKTPTLTKYKEIFSPGSHFREKKHLPERNSVYLN